MKKFIASFWLLVFLVSPAVAWDGAGWDTGGSDRKFFTGATTIAGPLTLGNATDLQILSSDSTVALGLDNDARATTLGYKAGRLLDGALSYNTFMGYQAGEQVTDGDYNVGIGFQALHKNNTGFNIAIGFQSLLNTTGEFNVGLGSQSQLYGTTASDNVGVGNQTMMNNVVGDFSVAIGFNSLLYNIAPDMFWYNTAIGYNAGKGTTGQTASIKNVFIGSNSGLANTTGGSNVLIGHNAGDSLTTGSGNVVIGAEADTDAVSTDNTAIIGHTNIVRTILRGVTENTVQSVTCADDAAGTNAALTITPTSSYVEVTSADAHGCDVTMGETGMAVGSTVTICVISVTAGAVNFADTAGVTQLAGAFASNVDDCLQLRYGNTTTWREVSRSAN